MVIIIEIPHNPYQIHGLTLLEGISCLSDMELETTNLKVVKN